MRKFKALKTLILPNGRAIEQGAIITNDIGIPAELRGYLEAVEVAADDEDKADKDSGKKAPKKR